MRRKARVRDAPSTRAASSRSIGTWAKLVRSITTAKGSVLVVVARMTASWVLIRSIWRKMTNIGVTSSGGGSTCDSMTPISITSIQIERTRASE